LKTGSIHDLQTLVYKIVKEIPKGKAATYGQISKIIQSSKFKSSNFNPKFKITPRVVGFILHRNTNQAVPCHRVVTKDGRIARNFAFGGWKKQRRRLLAEGVKFKDKMRVDLKKYGWKFK